MQAGFRASIRTVLNRLRSRLLAEGNFKGELDRFKKLTLFRIGTGQQGAQEQRSLSFNFGGNSRPVFGQSQSGAMNSRPAIFEKPESSLSNFHFDPNMPLDQAMKLLQTPRPVVNPSPHVASRTTTPPIARSTAPLFPESRPPPFQMGSNCASGSGQGYTVTRASSNLCDYSSGFRKLNTPLFPTLFASPPTSSPSLPHDALPSTFPASAQPSIDNISLPSSGQNAQFSFGKSFPSGGVGENSTANATPGVVLEADHTSSKLAVTTKPFSELGGVPVDTDKLNANGIPEQPQPTSNPTPSAQSLPVISISKPHPWIALLEPAPSLPTSIHHSYEAAHARLEKNPFLPFDDIIYKALEDIRALDEKYPGCKEALASLKLVESELTSRPVAAGSSQPESVALGPTPKLQKTEPAATERAGAGPPAGSLKINATDAAVNPRKRAKEHEHEDSPGKAPFSFKSRINLTEPALSVTLGTPKLNFNSGSAGSEPVASKPSSLTFATPTSEVSKPNFTFGAASVSKSEIPKLNLSFGATSDASKPNIDSEGAAASSSDVPKLNLSFGAFNQLKPDSTAAPKPIFSFGTSEAPSVNASKPNFSFGTSDAPSVTAPKPNFSFGTSDAPSVTAPKPNFSFGTSDAPSVTAPKPNFSFGTSDAPSVTAPKPNFSFGTSDAPSVTAPKPNFSFGTSDAPSVTAPKPNFSFGTSDAPSVTAPKPNFSFGTSDAPSVTTPKPNFSFGTSDAPSVTTPKPNFSFGTSDASSVNASKPNFSFGISGAPSVTAPKLNFTFGNSAAPNSKFTFGKASINPFANDANPVRPFTSFDNTSDAAAGATKDSIKLAAPSENPQDERVAAKLSENAEANGSEDEVREEGFSGTRTNDALILKGEGEEQEETAAQARVKLLGLDATTKAYKDMGVGILKVNCHQVTQRKRLVCRAEGSGRILMNSYIPDDVKVEVIPKPISLKFKAISLDGLPTMFVARTKELVEAKDLAAAIDDQYKREA
ncbi:hypothetical protein L0F63_003792 [Massospora cicadina]|nr:hypothetical protein L0F63_003792 [Massospora cicadina]